MITGANSNIPVKVGKSKKYRDERREQKIPYRNESIRDPQGTNKRESSISRTQDRRYRYAAFGLRSDMRHILRKLSNA